MSKTNIKNLIIPTVALTAICLIVTGLLSVTDYFTKDRIASAKAEQVAEAMQSLVPNSDYTDLKINGRSEISYAAERNGQTVGYIFITDQLGYKSSIQVMTALDTNGEIIGVSVIDCADESPGIGQKVGTEKSFTDQFIGQSGSAQADAITGATFSSKAVTGAVNDALEMYKTVNGGADNG